MKIDHCRLFSLVPYSIHAFIYIINFQFYKATIENHDKNILSVNEIKKLGFPQNEGETRIFPRF